MTVAIALGVAVSLGGFLAFVYTRQRVLVAQAITDPLTGVFNRRHLDSCLTQAIERRRRTGEPASLLMFDVDHFKRINDTYGHAGGDETLTHLVGLIAARVRGMDVLFRIGGDEFVLLLPGARHVGATAVGDTLRTLIADAPSPTGRRVSISIGVSELQAAQSASQWLEDADVALYRAKQTGRNRVSLSGRVPLAPLGRRPAHA